MSGECVGAVRAQFYRRFKRRHERKKTSKKKEKNSEKDRETRDSGVEDGEKVGRKEKPLEKVETKKTMEKKETEKNGMKGSSHGDGCLGRRGGLPWNFLPACRRRRKSQKPPKSLRGSGGGSKASFNFPVKQAATSAYLCLAGDTIAQFGTRWSALGSERKVELDGVATSAFSVNGTSEDIPSLLSDHDWLRSLRMGSYGFLLYGPGSHAWYQYLDCFLPKHTLQNMLLKVLLNQIVLGPCVIAVVFAWNDFWKGNLSELPKKYKNDALPALFYGFRFWIPASVLNFWVIPLHARVAFMSTCSIFWNFYLSSTMSK
ncbi:hypothetical protein Sjap_026175 [Stephania japonica]|uniref:Uncharacterized protein n=1 Tax=Stephania japonica TaxID=461633 RepID=A0AAP0EAY1_9MAGN